MVRLTLVMALLTGPVQAACFGPPMPQILRFDDGHVQRILSHNARDVTFRTLSPGGGFGVATVRDGLFPLIQSAHGLTTRFDWLTDLPDLASLTPGFEATYEADVQVEHAYRLSYRVWVNVLRTDEIRVGPCSYPVLVVARQDKSPGLELARLVLWLSPTLHMALRIETTQTGQTEVTTVAGME